MIPYINCLTQICNHIEVILGLLSLTDLICMIRVDRADSHCREGQRCHLSIILDIKLLAAVNTLKIDQMKTMHSLRRKKVLNSDKNFWGVK